MQSKKKLIAKNDAALAEAAQKRHDLEDRIWAKNVRRSNLDKLDGVDNRPAQDFDKSIDETEDDLHQ